MPHRGDEAHLGWHVRKLGRKGQSRSEETTLAEDKVQHIGNQSRDWIHTRAYLQGCDRTINCQSPENGQGGMGKRIRGKRGGRGEKSINKPDYHDFPFVKIVLIDESFAKMAIRLGELEGLQEYSGVRTSRKALNRMLG
jgi:hypothetical protein